MIVQQLWDEKYKSTAKRIEKRRQEHLKQAQGDAAKVLDVWRDRLEEKRNASVKEEKHFDEASYMFDNEFSFTWALKGEIPPPTAIVARRDTVSRSSCQFLQLGAMLIFLHPTERGPKSCPHGRSDDR